MSIDEKLQISVNESVPLECPTADDADAGLGSSPADERRLVRKVDMRIMPLICLLYLFACKFGFFTLIRCCTTDHWLLQT